MNIEEQKENIIEIKYRDEKKEKELDVIKKKKVKFIPEYSVCAKVIYFL